MIRNDENLLKLVWGLLTLPRHSEEFNMLRFKCATAACACGWAPTFVTPRLNNEGWYEYGERVFGLEFASAEWCWLFSGSWCRVDNTPWGAAGRIAWLIQRGLPRNSEAQRLGLAHLCYLPEGVTP